ASGRAGGLWCRRRRAGVCCGVVRAGVRCGVVRAGVCCGVVRAAVRCRGPRAADGCGEVRDVLTTSGRVRRRGRVPAAAPGRTAVWAGAFVVVLLAWAAAAAGMAYAADDPVPVTEDGLFGAPEEALFGASEDDLFSFDEDSLFGNDLLIEVDDPGGQALEEVFLVRDRIDAGGTYRAALAWSRMTGEDGQELWSGLSLTAGGSLYVDARPRRDFRAFAKLKGSGAWREGAGDADVTAALHELFVDVDHKDRAFFRIGKQTVTWGVGYFFSPADVINVGRINPEDPEAEREGPVAVRLHVPEDRKSV